MKMRNIYESEEVNPQAQASANSLILINALKNNPKVMSMLGKIYLPTDKYKAIKHFAGLLGVPDERFDDFITQQSNNSK